MKKIKMDEGKFLNQIIFIKYKKENMKEVLIRMKVEKKYSWVNHNRGEESNLEILNRDTWKSKSR